MRERDSDANRLPIGIATVALLWALVPVNPYGYYILLRWVCCPIFAYLAWVAFSSGKSNWGWTFGLCALIYNPIGRIALNRAIWVAINIASIAALLIFAYRQHRERATEKRAPP